MANTPPPAVSVRGLLKSFDSKVAVGGIDLDVPRGTFFGLLGPNGAGKSTTLAMVTGLLRPDRGSITVDGLDALTQVVDLKARIGVVPETLLLFDRLSGAEMLEYVGLLRGLDKTTVTARRSALLDVLGLADDANKLIVDYSQGMRKKISLAAALIHTPRTLFLDEPFESVDPISVRIILGVLDQLVTSGATVVFSSHVMATVEHLCQHVAIMHHGRVVAAGTMSEVCQGRSLDDAFAAAVGASHVAASNLHWLSGSPPPPHPDPPPHPNMSRT